MRWIYSSKTSENTGDSALLYSIWAGKQARLHVFTHTNASFNRTLDCCWCCTESPIFARTKVTFSPLPWHRFLQEHLPEQWPLLAFVSSISLPTIEICNARGLITSWETAPPPLRLFEQENQPLRADIVVFQTAKWRGQFVIYVLQYQSKSSHQRIPVRFQWWCHLLIMASISAILVWAGICGGGHLHGWLVGEHLADFETDRGEVCGTASHIGLTCPTVYSETGCQQASWPRLV